MLNSAAGVSVVLERQHLLCAAGMPVDRARAASADCAGEGPESSPDTTSGATGGSHRRATDGGDAAGRGAPTDEDAAGHGQAGGEHLDRLAVG